MNKKKFDYFINGEKGKYGVATLIKDSYKDFSYGLSFQIKDWAIIFGSIIHDNSALGAPKSVELKKYF